MSDLVFAASLECFPEKPRTVSDGFGLNRCARGEKSVNRSERSNETDTALYKNYLYLYLYYTLCLLSDMAIGMTMVR